MKQRITGVTVFDMEDAGLTQIEQEIGTRFWVDKHSVSQIAKERNVKVPTVCLTLDNAERKLLKLKEFPFAKRPKGKHSNGQRGILPHQEKQIRAGIFRIITASMRITAMRLKRLAETQDANQEETAERQAERFQKGVVKIVAAAFEEAAKKIELSADIAPIAVQKAHPVRKESVLPEEDESESLREPPLDEDLAETGIATEEDERRLERTGFQILQMS